MRFTDQGDRGHQGGGLCVVGNNDGRLSSVWGDPACARNVTRADRTFSDFYWDDPELDNMLKNRVRWGDPMAHLVKVSRRGKQSLAGGLWLRAAILEHRHPGQEVRPVVAVVEGAVVGHRNG